MRKLLTTLPKIGPAWAHLSDAMEAPQMYTLPRRAAADMATWSPWGVVNSNLGVSVVRGQHRAGQGSADSVQALLQALGDASSARIWWSRTLCLKV